MRTTSSKCALQNAARSGAIHWYLLINSYNLVDICNAENVGRSYTLALLKIVNAWVLKFHDGTCCFLSARISLLFCLNSDRLFTTAT